MANKFKESTNDDIENYIDDLRTHSKKDVPSYSKSYYFWSYYEFNISDNEWTKVSLSGKDYAKSLKDANNLAKSDDVVKAYLVFKNPNNSNENFKVIIKENDFYESKKSAKRSLKEEKATDSLFEDVVFSMIKKFKLKKEYDVERPSWSVFNFRHKNKDAQFAITFDECGHGDFLYGEVLAFGDEKDDIFKYKTDEVKVDSYNIEKECLNIIADCLAFIDTNKKITIFESKKSTKKSLKEKVTVTKSLKIIERVLLDLIHDDTIQEEFNMAFDDVDGIYDSVDDMFEVSVHNVLNKLLKEHTITVLPF